MSEDPETNDKYPKSSLLELCDDISSSSLADSDFSKSESGNNSKFTSPRKDLNESLTHDSYIKSGSPSLKSAEISIKTEVEADDHIIINNMSNRKLENDLSRETSEPVKPKSNPKGDDWAEIDLELEQLAKDSSLCDINSFVSEEDMKSSTENNIPKSIEKSIDEMDLKLGAKDTSLDQITSSDSEEYVDMKSSTENKIPESIEKSNNENYAKLEQRAKDTSLDDINSSDSEGCFDMKSSTENIIPESIEKSIGEFISGDVSMISEPDNIPVNADVGSQKDTTTSIGSMVVKVPDVISKDKTEDAEKSVMTESFEKKHSKVLSIECTASKHYSSYNMEIDSENVDKEPIISEDLPLESNKEDPSVLSNEPVTLDKVYNPLENISKEPDMADTQAVLPEDINEALEMSEEPNKTETISPISTGTCKGPVTSDNQKSKEEPSNDIPNVHSDRLLEDTVTSEKQYIRSDDSPRDIVTSDKQNLQSEPAEKMFKEPIFEKQNIRLDELPEEPLTPDKQNMKLDDLSKEYVKEKKSDVSPKESVVSKNITDNSTKKDDITSEDLPSDGLSKEPNIPAETLSESEDKDSDAMSIKPTSLDKTMYVESGNLLRETMVNEPSSSDNNSPLDSDTGVIDLVDAKEPVISETECPDTDHTEVCDNLNLDEKDKNTRDESNEIKKKGEQTISDKDETSKDKFDLLTEHSEENSGDGEVPDNTDTLGLFSVTSKPLDLDEEEDFNDEIGDDSGEDIQREKNYASETADFSDIDHSLESFATSMMDHEETSSSNNEAAANAFGLLISSVGGNSKESKESNRAKRFDSFLQSRDVEKVKEMNKEDVGQVDAEDKESSNGSELAMDLGETNENYEDMDIEENLVSTTSIFTAEEQESVDADLDPSKDSAEKAKESSSRVNENEETLIEKSSDPDVRPENTEEDDQIMEIVDLDSNSDDEPPAKKEKLKESISDLSSESEPSTTTINLPSGIEVMSTSETAKTSTIISNKGESLIQGIPKPLTPKKASGFRINTSEITISTVRTPQQEESDEVVCLDSDEEDVEKCSTTLSESLLKSALMKVHNTQETDVTPDQSEIQEIPDEQDVKKCRGDRCVNSDCTSTADSTEYYRCPLYVLSHYSLKRKGATQKVCEHCLESVIGRVQEVMNCAQEGRPLWEMHPQAKEDLVEISDSDEDNDDQDEDTEPLAKLSYHNVSLLQECLEQTLNDTWVKFNFDDQIKQSKLRLLDQLLQTEKECEELTTMYNDIQKKTDAMRTELYGEFPVDRHELSPLDITDKAEMMLRASLEIKMNDFSVTSSQHHKGLTPRKLSDDDDWTPAALGEEFPEPSTELDTQGRRSSRHRKSVNYRGMDGLADKESVTEEDLSNSTLDSFHKNALEVQKHIKTAVHRPDVIALPPPEPHTGEVQPSSGQQLEPHVTPNNEPSVISDSENCASGDDVSDVSLVGDIVVERAPADLPPNGELIRKPLQFGDGVYARKSATFGGWAPATVLTVWPRGTKQNNGVASPFTLCRVKFFVAQKNVEPIKQLNARNLAYGHPANVRYPIGARVVALFAHKDNDKKGSYYSGIIAETPTPVNDYRYMVFFDDGYVQYVQHKDIRLVVEHSQRVYEDVLQESRDFVKDYLSTYPERPMVRLQRGQALKVQDGNKKWSSARVLKVDASLAQVKFEEDNHVEWIYRGSTRLAPLYLELKAAGKPQRRRGLGLSKTATMFNTPYVEYTRVDSNKDKSPAASVEGSPVAVSEPRVKPKRGRAVAKKSLAAPPAVAAVSDAARPGDSRSEAEASRVVYYSPKIALKPQTMIPHECGEACRRTDVLTMHELRTYNPLARPLLTGFQRNHILVGGKRAIEYRAPCGRRLRTVAEMHRYLRITNSDMSVDLFHFDPAVHCLAEFVLNWCRVSKKDLSHGMENVPIPCVNFYDSQLPPFCAYSTARIPTVGVHLNLDPDFLCGCDCTDDCADKSKCACWQLTLSGARAIGKNSTSVGYHFKRLPEALPTGIFECNSKCKCRVTTCLNRVVQHPLQLKLQVFKTDSRGWGIRALNDVPKGTFLCIYSGNLLTDSTANVDGLLEGDEYLAELDYIEVVERMKEAFEPDVPLRDRILDSKGLVNEDDEDDDISEDESQSEHDKDFQPEYIDMRIAANDIGSRLRKRTKKVAQNKPAKSKGGKDKKKPSPVPEVKLEVPDLSDKLMPDPDEEFTITISDDDEAREPSSFAATAGCDDEEYIPRNMSVRELFGRDEKCYIMDAKVRGNIGRYLNHSCAPNVFVQNVFVDTHDPRFPWVGFFAQSFIRAGVELTWNYNYDIGSVPDKIIYCKCGTENCRGRLL